MSNVILTGKFSLGVQFLTGVLDLYALTLPRRKDILLRDLLKLEFFVQIIEFSFYVWMVRSWGFHSLSKIIQYRYYDWIITTPTMLITLMAFLGAREDKSLWNFVREHHKFITTVLSLNTFMLLFGLSGELGYISIKQSVTLGFVMLILYFGIIYNKFIYNRNVPKSKIRLFYYFFIIWSIYGVVALFPDGPKNIGYNILDLFAKNLLGVVLSVMLWLRPES